MDTSLSITGFVVIAFFYSFFGSTTVLGSIYLSKMLLTPKQEQIFFGFLLVLIAGFYLAFTAYFGNAAVWGTEIAAVAFFTFLGIVGIRVSSLLMLGYLLHGIWDIIHEFHDHADGLSWQITSIPLAYGFFCLAYDVLIVVYFWTRRDQWKAAWNGTAVPAS